MHDGQTDIVRRGVVAVFVRDERLLVIRRSQTVLAPGMYCFPGGGIEGVESEPEALVREIQEELNIVATPIRPLWSSVTSWRIALSWWLAELPEGQPPVPNPAEVESIHWHTIAEIVALPNLLESNADFLMRVARGEISLRAKE